MSQLPSRPGDVAVASLLGMILCWFGAVSLWLGPDTGLGRWIDGHPLGALIGGAAAAGPLAYVLGILQIALGVLVLPTMQATLRGAAGYAVAVLYGSSLTLLLTNPVWIPELGGFPAIGSGQGLLKHLTIAALGLWVAANAHQDAAAERRWIRLARWGVVLVLVWIGAMKFTATEAQGIQELVESHPLMAWLYTVTDVQGASNLIGIVELATAALILSWPRWQLGGALGLAFAIVTFLVTTSFLFTLPGWLEGHRPLIVGGPGRFLAKDLLLLAACGLSFGELFRSPVSRVRRPIGLARPWVR